MELEWEQGRQPAHTAAALAGAFLGAALGADCFLAADHLQIKTTPFFLQAVSRVLPASSVLPVFPANTPL